MNHYTLFPLHPLFPWSNNNISYIYIYVYIYTYIHIHLSLSIYTCCCLRRSFRTAFRNLQDNYCSCFIVLLFISCYYLLFVCFSYLYVCLFLVIVLMLCLYLLFFSFLMFYCFFFRNLQDNTPSPPMNSFAIKSPW